MLGCYVSYYEQKWDAYASTVTYVHNRQVHSSTNTHLFDLVLNLMIPDTTLESTVSSRKTHIAAEQRVEFLATLQQSLGRARASLQQTQERYKRDFVRHLCKARERVGIGDYLFIDVSGGVNKTLKLEHAVGKPYNFLGQD